MARGLKQRTKEYMQALQRTNPFAFQEQVKKSKEKIKRRSDRSPGYSKFRKKKKK